MNRQDFTTCLPNLDPPHDSAQNIPAPPPPKVVPGGFQYREEPLELGPQETVALNA
jgi:hypothetical protein